MTYIFGPNNSFPVNIEQVEKFKSLGGNAVEFEIINVFNEKRKIIWVYNSEVRRDFDIERIKKELGESNV